MRAYTPAYSKTLHSPHLLSLVVIGVLTELPLIANRTPYKVSSYLFAFVTAYFVQSNAWRIRLAAYGARLERVLGSRPQGFKSPILRYEKSPGSCEPGLFSVCAPPLVGGYGGV